jgi:hypothetical protein
MFLNSIEHLVFDDQTNLLTGTQILVVELAARASDPRAHGFAERQS